MNYSPLTPHQHDNLPKADKLRYWDTRARVMLGRFNLSHWNFKLVNTNRRLGACAVHTQTIELSKPYIALNKFEPIDDTLRHEIAHALTFERYGNEYARTHGIKSHGPEWKHYCKVTGAQPVAKKANIVIPWKYLAECSSCGNVGGLNTVSSRYIYYCNSCDAKEPLVIRRHIV